MIFADDDKQVKEFSERIPFGVTKVQLMLAESSPEGAEKEYIDIHVTTAEGLEDRARLWFTGGATNISFNTLRQIIVHGAQGDDQKAKARDAVDACADTDELVALINEKCIGGECWVTKYYDPSRTYENSAGETKRSINTNIYGYEPKLKPELMPQKSGADLFHEAATKVMPGSKEVPFASDGDAPGTTVAPEIPGKDGWA